MDNKPTQANQPLTSADFEFGDQWRCKLYPKEHYEVLRVHEDGALICRNTLAPAKTPAAEKLFIFPKQAIEQYSEQGKIIKGGIDA